MLFTAENAAEYGRMGAIASAAAKARRKQEEKLAAEAAAELPVIADEQARLKRVMRQIEKCDELMDDCDDPKEFIALTAAKERLWNLIFPKAGSLRPAKASRRPAQPLPSPIPPQNSPTPQQVDASAGAAVISNHDLPQPQQQQHVAPNA